MDAAEGQGEVTLKQEDVFDLSVPGKREEDYVGRGKAISIYSDPAFSPQNVSRTEILDFGDEGFLLDNLLTRDECEHIIKEGEKIGFEPIENGRLDYRSSERYVVQVTHVLDLSDDRGISHCVFLETKIIFSIFSLKAHSFQVFGPVNDRPIFFTKINCLQEDLQRNAQNVYLA